MTFNKTHRYTPINNQTKTSLSLVSISLLTLLVSNSNVATAATKSQFRAANASKPIKRYYDGKTNDLLTAGWTKAQLQSRKVEPQGDYNSPEWLRKVRYFNNTIALLDTTEKAGYGSLYGPKFDKPVSGFEYLTYTVDNDNKIDATFSIQIPDSFNRDEPCIVVAASSGSRGVYGAVATSGTWGLEKGCVVAYTDKGTSSSYFFNDTEESYNLDGKLVPNSSKDMAFRPSANFQNLPKTAIVTKHAHSQQNVESKWGQYVLDAARIALDTINKHFDTKKFTPNSTLIIAASISNGGAASIRAAEEDKHDLIDAVVVAEPNIYVERDQRVEITVAGKKQVKHSIYGYDYFSELNLYSPCALLSKSISKQPLAPALFLQTKRLTEWCESLADDGFLNSKTTSEQAEESLSKIRAIGISESADILAPLSHLIELWPALAMTYTNQFGRYSAEDMLCGHYFSGVDSNKKPISFPESLRPSLSVSSNGIPPSALIKLINAEGKSNYEVAKCFYNAGKSKRVRRGIEEVVSTGDLQNKPTIIIHGREDNLIAPNHSSRAYYATHQLNNPQENLRYYEITNAQHFDAFNSMPQFADTYVPLHFYFEEALELMFAHLKIRKKLPASKTVYSTVQNPVSEKEGTPHREYTPNISKEQGKDIKLIKNHLIIP